MSNHEFYANKKKDAFVQHNITTMVEHLGGSISKQTAAITGFSAAIDNLVLATQSLMSALSKKAGQPQKPQPASNAEDSSSTTVTTITRGIAQKTEPPFENNSVMMNILAGRRLQDQ